MKQEEKQKTDIDEKLEETNNDDINQIEKKE